MHVTEGAKLPLELGYVQTSRHPNVDHYIPTVYALDCEMVSVTNVCVYCVTVYTIRICIYLWLHVYHILEYFMHI